MLKDYPETERLEAARNMVKEYAQQQLGVDIGQMPVNQAYMLVLALLIEKARG